MGSLPEMNNEQDTSHQSDRIKTFDYLMMVGFGVAGSRGWPGVLSALRGSVSPPTNTANILGVGVWLISHGQMSFAKECSVSPPGQEFATVVPCQSFRQPHLCRGSGGSSRILSEGNAPTRLADARIIV
ncbi:hypothetical protein J3458_011789 [Metarhizium acridum]|uniref:uncharacterized protein n=1 Tax=Metarhizium acridum TaxID=92637 RepID=UPI001C6B1C48|nr:hypothetical protein J3458_011789 [Metarhizium acridum]